MVGEAVSILQECMQKTGIGKMQVIIKNTWLCIKYPFLYPRNRFTGLHYNNWKLLDLIKQLYKKYHYVGHIVQDSDTFYYDNRSTFIEYWKNWWALPLVKVLNWIHNYPMQWMHCLTSYTELDSLPSAWVKDFGLDWAEDTKQYLKAHKIKHYRIAQLKEKWGEFDWLYPPDLGKSMTIERKYVERSRQICQHCGKPATRKTQDWIMYLCDDCAEDYYSEPIND